MRALQQVRIGIFSLLYSLPTIAVLGLYVHEVVSHEPQTVAWFREGYCHGNVLLAQPANSQLGPLCRTLGAPNQSLALAATGGARSGPGDVLSLVTWPLVLRHALLFVVGIATTSWICSRKTFQSWRAFLARVACCCCHRNSAAYQATGGAVQSPSAGQLSHVTAQNLLQAPNNSNANTNSMFGGGSASGNLTFVGPQHVPMVGLTEFQQPLLTGYRTSAAVSAPGVQNMHQLQNLQNMRIGGVVGVGVAQHQHPAGLSYAGIAVMPAGAAQSSSLSASTGLTQQSGSATQQTVGAPAGSAKPLATSGNLLAGVQLLQAPGANMRYPVASHKAPDADRRE